MRGELKAEGGWQTRHLDDQTSRGERRLLSVVTLAPIRAELKPEPPGDSGRVPSGRLLELGLQVPIYWSLLGS